MYLPKRGEEYYYLIIEETIVKSIAKKKWEFDGYDITLYLMGNVFKSKKKAKDKQDRVVERLHKLLREVTVWRNLS